jgi:hypothetical protein
MSSGGGVSDRAERGITRAGLWLKTFIPSSSGRKPKPGLDYRIGQFGVHMEPGDRAEELRVTLVACDVIVPHVDPGTQLGRM